MLIINNIQHFFKYRANRADRTLIYLILFNLLLGSIFTLINDTHFHYPETTLFAVSVKNWFLTWNSFFWKIVTPSLLFFFYGIYIRTESPRASTFLWGIGFLPLCIFTNMVIANGIQATPFTPIDPLLVKIDHTLGINTPELMTWTHNHPDIHHLLTYAYNSLIFELIGLILIFTIFSIKKPLTIFYLVQLSTIIIGALFYYFFPTMAPSGIFHCPYFTTAQKDTSLRFYEIHHYLKITIHEECGLIAFPSFHVVWAILSTYSLRDIKIFFYPATVWNAVIIVSTVLLGWHYFADVIGGGILAAAGIIFAEKIYGKS